MQNTLEKAMAYLEVIMDGMSHKDTVPRDKVRDLLLDLTKGGSTHKVLGSNPTYERPVICDLLHLRNELI